MKRVILKPLPEWVPEVGTTVEITPALTPFLRGTEMTVHRAKVTSVCKTASEGEYVIKLENFDYGIHLSEQKELAWISFDNTWLNDFHVAF
jgi:hypothetical protein